MSIPIKLSRRALSNNNKTHVKTIQSQQTTIHTPPTPGACHSFYTPSLLPYAAHTHTPPHIRTRSHILFETCTHLRIRLRLLALDDHRPARFGRPDRSQSKIQTRPTANQQDSFNTHRSKLLSFSLSLSLLCSLSLLVVVLTLFSWLFSFWSVFLFFFRCAFLLGSWLQL